MQGCGDAAPPLPGHQTLTRIVTLVALWRIFLKCFVHVLLMKISNTCSSLHWSIRVSYTARSALLIYITYYISHLLIICYILSVHTVCRTADLLLAALVHQRVVQHDALVAFATRIN